MFGVKTWLRWGLVCLVGLPGCDWSGEVQDVRPDHDVVVAEEQWRVGAVSGAEWETLGRVTAVARDALGRTFVADDHGSLVRAYGPDGEHLGVVGREGDGPGEFLAPMGITPARDGSVWVRDSRRITHVRVSSSPWEVEVLDTWSGPTFPNSLLPGRFDAQGRYYYPVSRSLQRSGAPPEHFYLIYDEGEVVDTLFVPPLPTIESTDPAWVRTGASGGRVLPGLNRVPFSPTPSWDVLPDGRLVSTDGAAGMLDITDPSGEVVGRVPIRTGEMRSVPEVEREDSLAALTARLDSVLVPLDQVIGMPDEVRTRTLPEILPEVLSLHVDTVGRIWVRRWPAEGRHNRTFYDVFSVDGALVGAVELEVDVHPEVAPWIGEDGMVVVSQDSAYGFDQVVAYSFTL